MEKSTKTLQKVMWDEKYKFHIGVLKIFVGLSFT